MSKLAESFGKFVLSMTFSIVVGIYNAWLFKDLWNWFVSPSFGVGEIGTAMAYGLLIVAAWPLTHVMFFANQVYDKQDDSIGVIGRWFVISFVHSFIWVIAYVLANNFI